MPEAPAISYRKGFCCPCGHDWMLHDIEEYDGDGSDTCCVQGCDQKACPGRQPRQPWQEECFD